MAKTFVCIWDMETGKDITTMLYYLPPKDALICAIRQYQKDFNAWLYPKDIEGIIKSKRISNRYQYVLNDRIGFYTVV